MLKFCIFKSTKFISLLFSCGFLFGFFTSKYISRREFNFSNLSRFYNNNQHSETGFNFIYSSTVLDKNLAVCNVIKLDPWDPSIQHLIAHPKGYQCQKVQPDLTYIDYNGYLRYNEQEFEKVKQEIAEPFRCHYWMFDRGPNDTSIWYAEKMVLNHPVKLTKDNVEVVCRFRNKTQLCRNVHSHPIKNEERLFEKPTDDQLSVLFFVVDSVSYSVMQRNLPLTYNYTRNVMGMKYFNAFNKIGTNSYPNQMAMLTSRRVYYEQSDMPHELPTDYDYENNLFDTWPLIWKFFAARSYATVYNSDWPEIGLFNYFGRGFAKKVLDFYYHWFWLMLGKANSPHSSPFCFNNRPLPLISFDLAKRHIISMKDDLQFIYNCVAEATHSGDNEIERMDQYIFEFWKDVYEGGYLNKTVVIFSSDHGIRLGHIRGTYVGAMEDRLPFYSLWFPEWFYELHPDIKANIERNQNLLSSPFDVYETLKDIANSNYDGQQRNLKTSRGLSQLYPLPSNRTCRQAGIADHWCTCNVETPLNTTNNTLANEAAQYFINYMNNILRDVQHLCQKIVFSKFNFFREVQVIDKDQVQQNDIKQNNQSSNYTGYVTKNYFIGLETNPFRASFETYLTATFISNDAIEWSVMGGLSRVSRYAGYSTCVSDWWLSNFCPCYDIEKKESK